MLPKRDEATVEQRQDGHVVVAGAVIAGPFANEAAAWHWIDRNEVHEVWQPSVHWRSRYRG
jgi:hypothetical protein